METLETRMRHFQTHNKGNGSLQSLTFWGDRTNFKLLNSFRASLYEICKKYMEINCEEKYFRGKMEENGQNDFEYNPTKWRIVCSYEEVVERARQLHRVFELIASTDPELGKLVKPFPKFVISGAMWQEKLEKFQKKEVTSGERTNAYFCDVVTCCKSLRPLYDYLRDNGEFEQELEAVTFGFYRRDMEQYRKDTENDGF
ncbi:MAG: hypothetical protein J6A21_11425 [Lentisphaeria bacterium]|nr:hypothetical protein [Lentisphaeria bacterium]